jgi:hypothetical protein
MKVKSSSILERPTDATINSFENFCKVTLPSPFVEFIKQYNGAEPEKLIVRADNQERMIEKFLCLLQTPRMDSIQGPYDIRVVIAQIEDRLTDDENLVGTNVIPFAAVFGGDFLCLDYRDAPQSPSIVLWDHDESDELQPVTYPVSTNIEDFLKLIIQGK